MSHATASPLQRVCYPIEDAMAAIGIGRTKIYQEIESGRLEVVKVGRKTLVPAKSIDAWLAALPRGLK
jgi:excisionase family DNA binding protein